MAVEARARGKPSDHSTRDAARLTSVVGEVAMSNKLVEGEEANGRPDVGKLWCGFDRGEDTRRM